MPAEKTTPDIICRGSQVPELGKFAFTVQYRGAQREAILIRFQGQVFGYLNQCVHMPRPLDCEQAHIFDESGRYLQCSMHTICYDPTTGESLSEICAGKKLTALKVREEGEWVYLTEKKTQLESGGKQPPD